MQCARPSVCRQQGVEKPAPAAAVPVCVALSPRRVGLVCRAHVCARARACGPGCVCRGRGAGACAGAAGGAGAARWQRLPRSPRVGVRRAPGGSGARASRVRSQPSPAPTRRREPRCRPRPRLCRRRARERESESPPPERSRAHAEPARRHHGHHGDLHSLHGRVPALRRYWQVRAAARAGGRAPGDRTLRAAGSGRTAAPRAPGSSGSGP